MSVGQREIAFRGILPLAVYKCTVQDVKEIHEIDQEKIRSVHDW